MSSDGTNDSTPNAGNTSSERLTGRVKWFNNRAGFGFVTVLEGDKKDEDVFVHHSGIVVNSEQYKYLVQGEYVSFVLRESDNSDHPYQAGDVRGVYSGWLMCETRNAIVVLETKRVKEMRNLLPAADQDVIRVVEEIVRFVLVVLVPEVTMELMNGFLLVAAQEETAVAKTLNK